MNSSFVPSLVLECCLFSAARCHKALDGDGQRERWWASHMTPRSTAGLGATSATGLPGGWDGWGREPALPSFPGLGDSSSSPRPAAATFLQAAASWSRAWGLAWSLSSPDVLLAMGPDLSLQASSAPLFLYLALPMASCPGSPGEAPHLVPGSSLSTTSLHEDD